MGYASLLEDIRDRIADGLDNIAKDLKSFEEKDQSSEASSLVVDKIRKLQAIYKQCESLLDEINHLLEIVTEPDLEIAHELAYLRLQLPYLQERSEKLDEEIRRRQDAEKKAEELQQELIKRMQRKHYIKGTAEKRQKKLLK